MGAHEVMGAHYAYDTVGDDGTTELLAEDVDMQTALAISAEHARTRRGEEP